ncbi:reverse transcriptase domain-containing protein [Tanacetum coccineum]
MEFTYALRFEFEASNNKAEHEALIAGLRITEQIGVQILEAKLYTPDKASPSRSTKREVNRRNRDPRGSVEEEGYSWITPLLEYLMDGTLPAEVISRAWLGVSVTSSSGYVVGKSMRGHPTAIAFKVECPLVARVMRSWYYWPTMHKDAQNIIQKCDGCQVHRSVPKNPQQKLTLITSPWMFYKCGIDISGPFLKAQGKVKFLIVAVDYFTKWFKAKPVATINGNQINKFMWDNICEKFNVKQRFASIKHPHTNKHVERVNRSLGDGIKARLGGDNKNWVEEVPHVLWAHRTEIKSSNGHTSFSLTYGTEVVILVEIGMPSLRCEKVDQAMNDEALLLNLDIREEMREKAAI